MSGLQPFDPAALVLVAALNPAVILVAFLMGRAADQSQKIVVAAFAAAVAGAALIWIAAFLKLLPARGVGGEAGVFALQFIFGIGWAALGYRFRRNKQ